MTRVENGLRVNSVSAVSRRATAPTGMWTIFRMCPRTRNRLPVTISSMHSTRRGAKRRPPATPLRSIHQPENRRNMRR